MCEYYRTFSSCISKLSKSITIRNCEVDKTVTFTWIIIMLSKTFFILRFLFLLLITLSLLLSFHTQASALWLTHNQGHRPRFSISQADSQCSRVRDWLGDDCSSAWALCNSKLISSTWLLGGFGWTICGQQHQSFGWTWRQMKKNKAIVDVPQ